MNVIMCSPNEVIAHQMLKQGYLPSKGLGKHSQGIKTPISVTLENDRAGLGAMLEPDPSPSQNLH